MPTAGTWIRDTKNALEDIGFPEANASNFKTISKDGYKMLNTPSGYYIDADQFWTQYNKPWLDDLVSKKADFVILSDKTEDLLKYKWVKENGQAKYVLDANLQKIKTGFCKEIEYMENLVQQGKYQWDGVNGVYKYIGI